MKALAKTPVAAALALVLAGGAGAADASDWIVRVGGHYVDPKSDNHEVVSVDSGQSLTFTATYMLSPHLGVEPLAAWPFSHDITLNADGSKVAETKHLPPTLSLQYHFLPDGRIRPYVGAGLNATIFFDEKTTGALEGANLSLDDSFGAAAQLGVDFALSGDWMLNVDARWIDIDTDARLDGVGIGSVAIDPYAFGISIGRRFGDN
jgi:outer membrane protein